VLQGGKSRLNVVLFSGGRGSSVLSTRLVRHPKVSLTVAVNGYDDGASTGEIRRFLGDSLGPSDFRKNASRLARELRSCPPALIDLLDLRLPDPCTREEALAILSTVELADIGNQPAFAARVRALASGLDATWRKPIAERLGRFVRELESTRQPFEFSDCAVGNLVFAGSFLAEGRTFNTANDDYSDLLGLPPGLVENVTDGTNAFLAAIDVDDRLLGSEAEIVDAKRRNRIKDIYLVDRPLTDDERRTLESLSPDEAATVLSHRAQAVAVNPRLVDRIARADLIIYSPGTQHSSLFPSYLTPGLSAAIARNLTAIKLLVTNIQADAEIVGSSAVDIIERALYYLKEKGRLRVPTPCLITHYVMNDPGRVEATAPYVPLGRLETLEDPRLVRIGHYEDGLSGRHDAEKILTPFLESLLTTRQPPAVAIWLHDANSPNKISQTILEMVRGGVENVSARIVVYYSSGETLDSAFTDLLPFETRRLESGGTSFGALFQAAAQGGGFDYAVLFESSGMYQGEDLVELISLLGPGRLDAVWGSRRLSVRDIEASQRLRYRRKRLLGLASTLGSHVLSLTYLLLFGRYISDTLSGARALRTSYLTRPGVNLEHKLANQYLLSALLSDKADLLEIPVRFFPISPERVKRTSIAEGLHSLIVIAGQRLKRRNVPASAPPARGPQASGEVATEVSRSAVQTRAERRGA
jgi:2-phospho-L-lactate transferase/gluconeogenesis factor (CofD/UPF0052 family)